MIGWTNAKKPRSPKQMRFAAIATERKRVKTYMSAADQHDINNLYWAQEWLKQRSQLGESHHRVRFALRVMERLKGAV